MSGLSTSGMRFASGIALKMMSFVSKMMSFVLKMMSFVLKMMNFDTRSMKSERASAVEILKWPLFQ